MAVSQKVVQDVLMRESTDKYNIKYGGYRHNHLAHVIVALYHLGAKEEVLESFVQYYIRRLEKPLAEELEPFDDIESIIGKRQSFVPLMEHYRHLLEKYGSTEKLIKKEYPRLSPGLGGGAIHGIIHLGYGYNVRSDQIVLEGLALSAHDYTGLQYDTTNPQNDISRFGQGNHDITDVLGQIQQQQQLHFNNKIKGVLKKKGVDVRTGRGFSDRFNALCESAGDDIMEYANKIKTPGFEGDKSGKISKLMDWVLNCAVTVYTRSSQVNNFFLLHGVTAAWGLREVVPLMSDDDALKAIRDLVCAILVVYIAENSGPLSVDIDEDIAMNQDVWDDIVERTLNVDKSRDMTHILKLVQVCYLMWKCGTYPEMSATYLTAAKIVLETEHWPRNYPSLE